MKTFKMINGQLHQFYHVITLGLPLINMITLCALLTLAVGYSLGQELAQTV